MSSTVALQAVDQRIVEEYSSQRFASVEELWF